MLASPRSVRREKQVQTNQKFITMEERILDKTHHRFDSTLVTQCCGSRTGARVALFSQGKQPRSELQCRERINQEARLHALHEMEELKRTQNWEMTGLSPEEL